ncbi:MAG: apolipoprotein N-acyltransferase [Clostridia bacterium]|nr:apolipoprotein N-acyltransferase [Clostridia bacterium]
MENKRKTLCLPYLLIGAVLTGLTLVFPQIGFLEWLTMIPLFIGAYRLAGRSRYGLGKTYLYGFLTVYAYYFVVYHWITYLYPLDFVGLDSLSSIAVVIVGWLGLPLLQAIPGGLVFLLFKLMHRTEVFRRVPLLRPFAFSALWVVFEWSSTLGWTGVPWGRLCLGQAECLPMLQSASLFGSYFVSFLLLLVNGLLAYVILYHKRVHRVVICSALAVILIVANYVGGTLLINTSAPVSDTLRVAVVQGNINSHEKWSSESLSVTKSAYGKMTRQAAAEGAELVVWPETTFPYLFNRNSGLQDYASALARECNVTLVVGALYEDDFGKEYNALYLIYPDGTIEESIYAKRHLVPFGEYVPMREVFTALIPPLANMTTLEDDLMPGTDTALFDTEWGKIGSLICFDSIYEELAFDSARDGAALLLLSTNDSWFLDSAAVYQHEAQAMLRAIENGRYLVRSGNTGISTVITEKGEHLVWIEPLVEGYAVADVEMIEHNTLYTVIGNSFVYVCMGFSALLLILGVFLRKKRG